MEALVRFRLTCPEAPWALPCRGRSAGHLHSRRCRVTMTAAASGTSREYDVVIAGAGIIGLAIANSILFNTNYSVAVVDAAKPCAGATGAGQGYIWLGHRQPGTPGWALASRSKQLWEQLVADLHASGLDPLDAVGWRNTGSLLVASTHGQVEALKECVASLSSFGVAAQYLSPSEARQEEPALSVPDDGGAALVPGDSQLDAQLTVDLLRQRNASFKGCGRYEEVFNNPVDHLIRSPQDGSIQGLRTSDGLLLFAKEKVVVATGAWSSIFMSKLAKEHNVPVVPPILPRKGHLLLLQGLPHVHLKHALMEFEYTSNYSSDAASSSLSSATAAVAMTATISPSGDLLLGSSREFKGFDLTPDRNVVERMFQRVAKFLPALAEISLEEAFDKGRVRIGLRPFCSDGRPIIGSVPGFPGLLLAAGHEGSGLCMALGTAELVVEMILGCKPSLDPLPYSPSGRLTLPAL